MLASIAVGRVLYFGKVKTFTLVDTASPVCPRYLRKRVTTDWLCARGDDKSMFQCVLWIFVSCEYNTVQ